MKVPFEMVPFAGDRFIFEGVFFGNKNTELTKKCATMDNFEGNFRDSKNHPGIRLHDLARIYPDTQI